MIDKTIPFPARSRVLVDGKPARVVRDDNLDKRFVALDKPGPKEKSRKWVPLAELVAADERSMYTEVSFTSPEPAPEPGATQAVPIPPRDIYRVNEPLTGLPYGDIADPLPTLPEADPDADTAPVEVDAPPVDPSQYAPCPNCGRLMKVPGGCRYCDAADTVPVEIDAPPVATPAPEDSRCPCCGRLPTEGRCWYCADVADDDDEVSVLRDQIARLTRERDEANEATREAVAKALQVQRSRDGLADIVARNMLLDDTPPPAPKLRREYLIVTRATVAALESCYADGWTIETMQFTASQSDARYSTDADLNIVAWRLVPEPVSPPQPEASKEAILTADFVRESILPPAPVVEDVDTEIDHQPQPVTLHINKQPDSRERTAELYQRRKLLLGQRKAGSFIAAENARKKYERILAQPVDTRSLAERLADAGLPVAAQIAATGAEDTKAILNAQAYQKAKEAYEAAMGNVSPSRPLISASNSL